jgi:pyridoxal 5'-phosphate synthase pdxT subunit
MDFSKLTIGVLDLQGCVEPHLRHLRATGCQIRRVKKKEELQNLHGLIIPGGESTTLLKLIDAFDLEAALKSAAAKIPFWGICAGSILMASLVGSPKQKSLQIMDFQIARNAYGRQKDSFNAEIDHYPVAFIRAPKITQFNPDLKILWQLSEGEVVGLEDVRSGHQVCTFHSELSEIAPSPFHLSFVQKCHDRNLSVTESSALSL